MYNHSILDKHGKVFKDIPPKLPLDKGFQRIIEVEEGTKPIIITRSCHPKIYKENTGKVIKDLLDTGHI